MRMRLSSSQEELAATFASALAEGDPARTCRERRWDRLTSDVDEGGFGLDEAEAVLLTEALGGAGHPLLDCGPPRRRAAPRLRLCGYLLGLARRALDLAVRRAHERSQFGTTLAHQQAVTHPLAASHARVEAARWRLWQLATEDSEAAAFTGLVRELALATIRQALHVHGAHGLTDEAPVSACYRLLLSTEDPGLAEPVEGGDPERRRVPRAARETHHPVPSPHTVDGLWAEAVERYAQHTALRTGTGRLTYRELDQRATALARELRSQGVGRDVPVGIRLPRGADLVTAVLAVVKAGGAYLPLDPGFPADRLDFMVRDSGVRLVLDTEGHHRVDSAPLPPVSSARDLVYLIYTSGSTGRPKGVQVEHRSLVNRLRWDHRTFGLGPGDVVPQHTSLSFDISAWELFAPLTAGATLVPAPGEPAALAELLPRVTVLAGVPSLFEVLLDTTPSLADCPDLRYLFSGGETLTAPLARRLLDAVPRAQLHNFYGPSEATIDVTSWHCTPDGGVPIGRPIDNVTVRVLDDAGAPAPVGCAGELYVGGLGLARGYHNRPELTAERFPGRWYRTGDLVRFRRDGALEFVGRTDDQVQLGGIRVEPGEVASVLCAQPEVRAAEVTVAGGARLAAHVLADGASGEDLLDRLRHRLPAHLVPARVTVLPEFPLLPNGKVDRAALREFAARTATDLPGRIAELMGEVLDTAPPDPAAGFFDLGGTSLQAARFVRRVRADLGVRLSLQDFLTAPTSAAIAEQVRP
ncbi:amino acid adenylation domain-containing protein [Crossiella equi]|uniref:Amino acid adenylation domain-containing protein n=1 Tax=Crossiella equi TaxID=130796 RepID=A0ABS5A4S7_9PSEU|nr:amino acid adenylation domain-containing protein [Crossiella equi]MBP2471584.1 amino acid adenylation domain-containing protein [Crossiella equi]